ncbi:BNR/Asp-box repeat containing protein [Legionella cherrii]|uniref:BNR/Asp-box repeat containing protein n=1 Tax=Legionella cherrii TaxID=28084 RepID=A0A0W0SCA8_9GAMM|nr:sialidase family protein [Legionella cherrii]KTC81164.1 BNR/Asp-box repeat containing protein [Legionella cherrii]
MNKKYHLKHLSLALALCSALPTSLVYAAANFSITPMIGPVFPSSIYSGETVYAYYTITNKTSSTRAGYMIQGLPASVTQVTNSANPAYCQNQITLTAGSSCTLLLSISKPVKSSFALCKGTSCTTADTPLNVKQSTFLPPEVAGGQYSDGAILYPLLANSQNGGATWSYVIEKSKNLPSGFTNLGAFFTTSCSGLNCVAGGNYADGPIYYPLLAYSQNGGGTWTYSLDKNTPLPSGFSGYGNFESISCSGLNCTAVGQYIDGGILFPLLANSQNNGATWTYVIDKSQNLPSGFSNFSNLGTVSCSGLNCVAGGFYADSLNTQYPILANSQNGGTTWTYVIDKSKSLPTGYAGSGVFYGVSCSGLHCVAGGQYADSSIRYPILAYSQNGGATWTYAIDKSKTLPSGFANLGTFYSVSCSGLNCVAGGQYSDGLTQYPLLAYSQNGGATWTYTIEKGKNLPAGFADGGLFFSVNCSGLNCVAGGQYSDGSILYPLLASSQDGGTTWTYTIAKGKNLPAGFTDNGTFLSMNCSGSSCVASGLYSDNSIQYPLVANSQDGGVTWIYSIDASKTLPFDFSTGGFINSGVVSSLLPESLALAYQVPESYHAMEIPQWR